MGDSVNIASRLEGLNKYYGTSILISAETFKGVKKTIKRLENEPDAQIMVNESEWGVSMSSIRVRRMEKVKVKGKNESKLVYEVLPLVNEYNLKQEEEFTLYEQGYTAFIEGRFHDALKSFEQVRELQLDTDNLVSKKIEMCQEYIRSPPSEWDGSIRMDDK
jgi:adenylate cyclase